MLPNKWMVEVTRQEILDWFNDNCNAKKCYGSHHIGRGVKMCYPNYKTGNGFLKGDHLIGKTDTKKGYTLITEEEFITHIINKNVYQIF